MRYLLILVVGLLFVEPVIAETPSSNDWPQWQGFQRDAISTETGLLQEWPKAGPKLAWRAQELGGGYGSPSIANGRIYGMSNQEGDEIVWSISEKDGSEVWTRSLGATTTAGMRQGSEGPGSTPTIDGERLYVLGSGGTLACLEVADGTIVWKRNIAEDFGGKIPTWRYNESPLIDDGKVICTPGGDEATLVALDKSNGELIWKSVVPPGQTPAEREETSRGDDRNGARERGTRERGGRGRENGRAGRGGDRRSFDWRRFIPAYAELDADEDGEISKTEMEKASTALAKLDKNQDGKLSVDELTSDSDGRNRDAGQRGGRENRERSLSTVPLNAQLDANKDDEIDADEIKKATSALQKLDKNKDGKLTEEEIRPQFGRGGERGGDRGRRGGHGGRGGSGAGYASAIAIEFEGVKQYVQLTAKSLVGISAEDGKLLWRYDRPANDRGVNCSTPVYKDGLVFASSAYGNGGGAARLTREEDGSIKAEEVYFTKDMQNHHGGMVVIDGDLYGANGGNGGGFLVCLDFKSGDLLWRDRKAPKGSLAAADGMLYLFTEGGDVLLIKPSHDKYIENGRFSIPDRSDSPAWAHPVIANGKLYIRDQGTLLCYDVKAEGT